MTWDKQGLIKTEKTDKQENNTPRTLLEALDSTATPDSVSSHIATTPELQVLQKADIFLAHCSTPRTDGETESSCGNPSATFSPAAISEGINDSLYMKLMAEDAKAAKFSSFHNEVKLLQMEMTANENNQDVKMRLQRSEELTMQSVAKLDEAAMKHDELISKLDLVLESNKSIEKAVITKEIKAMKKEFEKLKKDNKDLAEKNKRLESSKKELASRNAEIAKEHAKLLREKKKNSRLRP